MTRQLSIIIPVFNEQDNVEPLHQELTGVLERAGLRDYEILFVDDGSTDDTRRRLAALRARDGKVRSISFQRNMGKAAAYMAGFGRAQGQILITMDGDLQDDPADIPCLLAAVARGCDVVIGWKIEGKGAPSKRIPSLVFNWLVRRLSPVEVHDLNCPLRALTRRAADCLQLYGDLYRFIPLLLHQQGFRVDEVAVHNRPRLHGKSKYGFRRFGRGLLDLATVAFLSRYRERPLHFFGAMGFASFALGALIEAVLLAEWLARRFGERLGHDVLVLMGVFLMLAGIQFVTFGFLGDLLLSMSGRQAQWIEDAEASHEPRV